MALFGQNNRIPPAKFRRRGSRPRGNVQLGVREFRPRLEQGASFRDDEPGWQALSAMRRGIRNVLALFRSR